MAEESLEKFSFGDFNIENSGSGSQALLDELLTPETSTADPTKIEKIEDKPKKVVKAPVLKTEDDEDAQKPVEKSLAERLQEDEEEEEEEVVIDPTKKTTPITDPEVPAEGNTFSALAKDLLKLGVFSSEEGEEEIEVKTEKDFLERFNFEKKKGAVETLDKFIGQFGEDYQDAFQAIYVKGVDPREYFSTYNRIEDYANLDMTVEGNQIAVVKQMLTDQGLEPEDVTSEIEQIKNYGDLEAKSQKYHKVLIKKEAAKLQTLEQESQRKLQAQQSARQQYQQNVQNVLNDKLKAKEFDGIPINPKLAGELQDFLLTDKWKTPSGETLSDFDKAILDLKKPENHAQKVKVALLIKLLEKDPTLSTIQKAGITKKTDAMFSEVVRQTSKGSGKVTTKPAGSSFFNNL